MIGYYPACELFEFSDQEQLIYIFGCSKPLLETKGWMIKNIKFRKNTKQICLDYLLINLSKKTHLNVDDGLQGACQGDHLHLISLMIEKGATDWNHGLECACKGGHLHLVNLMIEKGATHCGYCDKNATEHPK